MSELSMDQEENRERSQPATVDPAREDLTVLYAEPVPADLRALAAEVLPVGLRLEIVVSRERDELHRRAEGADFLLVSTARIDDALLRAAPRLRLIQHQGVGYDNIDVAACRRAGVPVALTPEGTTIGVAEHTLLLILAVFKHLLIVDAAVRRGEWPVWELRTRSYEFAGKTLGLIGFGRIGREVARRARAFDAAIIYHDVERAPVEVEDALGAAFASLDDLLRQADVVSLHLPLTPESRGLIGERALSLMHRQAVLINTARGALVDETALARALGEGWIAGAGLDVFEEEPPRPDNPLLACANAVLTPHIAAGTRDAYVTKLRAAFGNMQRVARGEAPLHQV